MNKKLIRITTVPISFKHLLKGQMAFMCKNGFNVTMISSGGKGINEIIKREKCKHVSIKLTRKITPIQDLLAIFSLYNFLKNENPQIVHTHTPKAGLVGMLASFLAGVPIRLHTVAGLPLMEVTGLKRCVLNFVEKLTYKCSTKVYPNSYGLKKIILKHRFASENKLKVIGNGSSNGIDTTFFNPELYSIKDNETLRTRLGIKKTDFVFIFVGRIVSDKGINELVTVFDKICLVEENLKLLLVGPFEDELDPLQKKTNLLINSNKNIISVGYQNDVRPYFSISNCLVFPSYREGFPNVVMQAGAMELPSIVTDINGCNEIIVEGKNGWIIPVKDENALLNTMKNCLSESNTISNMKSNTRDIIIKKYKQDIVWNAILEEYKLLEKAN